MWKSGLKRRAENQMIRASDRDRRVPHILTYDSNLLEAHVSPIHLCGITADPYYVLSVPWRSFD